MQGIFYYQWLFLHCNGYEKFAARYSDNSHFCFILYEDRGHNDLYYSEIARHYKEQLNKDKVVYVEKHGGEQNAEIKAQP